MSTCFILCSASMHSEKVRPFWCITSSDRWMEEKNHTYLLMSAVTHACFVMLVEAANHVRLLLIAGRAQVKAHSF